MAFVNWSVIAGETPTATKWNLLGGNDADFNSRINDLETGVSSVVSLSDASTISIDLSLGKRFSVQLGANNRTFSLSNDSLYQAFLIRVKQPSSGGPYSVNWFSGINWIDDFEPPLSVTADAVDVFVFLQSASNVWDGYTAGLNIQE